MQAIKPRSPGKTYPYRSEGKKGHSGSIINQKIMKLVSWHCRELGGQQKVEAIKRFKFIEKITILTIQDTKMQEAESLAIIKKNWKNGY